MKPTVVAVLAKFNKNRGVISWTFQTIEETNEFLCVRNDGRVIEHDSIEDLRAGYKKLRDEYEFVRLA